MGRPCGDRSGASHPAIDRPSHRPGSYPRTLRRWTCSCRSSRRSSRCWPSPSDDLPTDDGWLFEPKWDGFRALVFKDGDEIYIQSRDLKPLGRYFPELEAPLRAALPERCVLDGEIVIAARRRPRLRGAAAAHPPGRLARQDARRGDARVVRRVGPARARRRGPPRVAAGRAARAARGARSAAPAARPPHARHARSRGRRRLVRAVRGRGARRRRRQAARRALPAGQAGDAQDQAPAHRRLRRRRLPLVQGRPGHARRLAAARPVRRRRARCTTSASPSSFTWDRRAELVEELAPLREDALEGHPWADWAEWAAGRPTRPASALPGATSRWNRGKDLSWEPLRVELVVEVAYDHLQGDRFRHATHFKRWRPDKPPTDCRYDQLEVTAPVRAERDLRALTVRRRRREAWSLVT